eukprot:736080_1
MSSRFLLALYVYVVYVSFSFQVTVCDATERSISAENYPYILCMILFGGLGMLIISFIWCHSVFHMFIKTQRKLYASMTLDFKIAYITTYTLNATTCIAYTFIKTDLILPFIYRILPCNFVYFVCIGSYAASKYSMYILFILKIHNTFRHSVLEYPRMCLIVLFVCLTLILWTLFAIWSLLVIGNHGVDQMYVANHRNLSLCVNHDQSRTSFIFLALFGLSDVVFSTIMVVMFVTKLAKLRKMQKQNHNRNQSKTSFFQPIKNRKNTTSSSSEDSGDTFLRKSPNANHVRTISLEELAEKDGIMIDMNPLSSPKSYRIRSFSNPTHPTRDAHLQTDSMRSLSIGDRIRKMSKQAIEYDEETKQMKKRDLHARQRMKELKQLMAKQTLLVCVAILSSFVFFFGGAFVFRGITFLIPLDVMMNCFCVYLMLNTNEANMIWNSCKSMTKCVAKGLKYYLCCCVYIQINQINGNHQTEESKIKTGKAYAPRV